MISHWVEIKRRINRLFGLKNLYDFTQAGDAERVQGLLKRGADPNRRGGNSLRSDEVETALHAAVRNRHVEVVRLLLSRGADVNARETKRERTPLHLVVDHNYYDEPTDTRLEIMRLLIAEGADVNARDRSGETPLHVAITRPEIMALLLANGADVSVAKSYWGRTPLHIAALAGCLDSVKLLVEHGADVNARTKFGYGLNDDSEIRSGSTPLDYANHAFSLEEARKISDFLRQRDGKLS